MKSILVIFHSQEKGNTRKLAELVAQGCVEVPGIQVQMLEAFNARIDMDKVEKADGLALGSPDYFTYMAGGLKQFFDDLCIASWAGKKVKGKPYVAFLTHGGGGGIRSIEDCAKAMGLVPVAQSLLCKDAPEGSTAQQAIELGKALAKYVTR